MKSLAVIAIGMPLGLCAQGQEKTIATDTGTVVLHYFTAGGISTKAWTDSAGRWGRSSAYNKQGQVIFDRQTRRFAGHASVHFSYHANGAVSKAQVSEAPDGGIQWYRSTTSFDTAGNQTGFDEQGWDNEGPIGPRVAPVLRQTEVREQEMFTSEYFVVARKNCRVHVKPVEPSPAAKEISATMLRGDTLRGGMYSMGELWDDPLRHVTVTATGRNGKRKYRVAHVATVQVNKAHRRYYLILGR